MRLMENNNPLVRLVAFGRVKKMMKQFEGNKIDYLEKNMMRGMFKRKLKDFGERMEDNPQTLEEKLKFSNFNLEA